MSVHKANTRKSIKEAGLSLGIFLAVSVVISFFRGTTALWAFLVIAIIYLIGFLLVPDIDIIEVNSSSHELIISKRNFFFSLKPKLYKLPSITYTYKQEAISINAKGKCLRIYRDNLVILKLTRNDKGWNESKTDELVRDFDLSSVKRRSASRHLQDVFPG